MVLIFTLVCKPRGSYRHETLSFLLKHKAIVLFYLQVEGEV